jgi:hypothetical protein
MKRHRGVTLRKLCGLAAAATLVATSLALAATKPGIVRTREGQTYIGELDESQPENVTVIRGEIKTPVPRNRIASVEYSADFEKSFRDRLGKLPPNDAAGRLKLAREAMDRRQLMLAREATAQAQEIDPNNADAKQLMDVIQGQIRLERMQHQPPSAAATAGTANEAAGVTTQPVSEKLLKSEQINAIRQAELRPDDVGVRIRFERDVKRRFMEYTSRTPAEINSMAVGDLVQAILKEGTPEMRRDVMILNDPPSMFQYRRHVQPFVLQNCATTGCHGTVKGQKFALVSPGDSDAAAYTNFYILQSYIKKVPNSGENIFGHGELRMIDRQAPEQSLLLQNGLPGAIAEHDHPDVAGFRPTYRALTDQRYLGVRNWIAESLVPVPPEYGFTFGSSPATQPDATQPATKPAMTRPATRPGMRPPPPRPLTPPPAPR